MAVHIDGIYDNNLRNLIKSSKIFVVGAGGIGCELLKNLVLAGFENLEIVSILCIKIRLLVHAARHLWRSKGHSILESSCPFDIIKKIT